MPKVPKVKESYHFIIDTLILGNLGILIHSTGGE
jgi:hypothetical protein